MENNLHFRIVERASMVVSGILLIIIGPAGLAGLAGAYFKLLWLCFKMGWDSLG